MKDERQLWIILFITSLGSFLTPFMGSSINVAIPEIGMEFFSDAILLSWVAISYLLAASILIVPMGRLADMKGKTRIFLTGIAIYTAGSLLSTMTSSIDMLILFRVIQGCGGAMIFGTSIAIISGIFPPAERGGALGINVAFTYTGLSVGPVVGGALTEAFGWRSIFYLNAAVGILIIILGIKYLRIKETKDDQTAFDLPGSVLYGAMILFVMLGFQELPNTAGYVLFALGAAFAAAFFFREKSTPHPVIRISLFTEKRVFALANFAAFINYSSTFAISYLLSYYLQLIRGFGPEEAGLFLDRPACDAGDIFSCDRKALRQDQSVRTCNRRHGAHYGRADALYCSFPGDEHHDYNRGPRFTWIRLCPVCIAQHPCGDEQRTPETLRCPIRSTRDYKDVRNDDINGDLDARIFAHYRKHPDIGCRHRIAPVIDKFGIHDIRYTMCCRHICLIYGDQE